MTKETQDTMRTVDEINPAPLSSHLTWKNTTMKRKEPERAVGVKQEMEDDEDEDAGNDDDEDNDDDANEDHEEADEDDGDGDGDDSLITVRMDRNLLNCPICHKPFQSCVYQCQNGHVACSRCCTNLLKKCNICSLATGSTRASALESMLKSIRVSCRHSKFGCIENLPYAAREAHEKTCQHAPCYCPMAKCTFKGPTLSLSTHFSSKHSEELWYFRYGSFSTVYMRHDDPFHILNGKDGRLFLVLNGRDVASGYCLSLACIRPSSDECDLEYEIIVMGDKGNVLYLKGSPLNMTKWDGVYPSKYFLFVPSSQLGPRRVMKVDVKIRQSKRPVPVAW